MAELTPMKIQYNEIKEQHKDCLLFFRLGDFYEMFDEDAITASGELELTLTTRDRNKPQEEQTPMCGVPYHSAEAYIARLIAKGYKVAICEQTQDPALAKGLVTRDVVRIITPGTVTDASMLQENKSNYMAAIFLDGKRGGVCFADVSTGEVMAASYDSEAVRHIINELGRFSPCEAMLNTEAFGNAELSQFLKDRIDCILSCDEEKFAPDVSQDTVCKQLGATEFSDISLAVGAEAVCASGALLSYLNETQKIDLSHINKIETIGDGRYMELDYTTLRNLELTSSLRTGEKRGSLLWVLDKTGTPMGARLLRAWVERPLLNPSVISQRLAAVNELVSDSVLRGEIMYLLKEIGDIRRLAGKAVYATANGKDLNCLARYCSAIPKIKNLLASCKSAMLKNCAQMDNLKDVRVCIESSICDDPPFSVREGGILRRGFNEEVDYLRSVKENGAQMVIALEERERQRTGIKKLKVGYNRVFGYYIDVPRSQGDTPLPDEYIRKQTLVSNERYFTQELKELEQTLLSADDKVCTLEYELFSKTCNFVAGEVKRLQAAADSVGAIDCLCSFAETAVRNNYCMPQIDMGSCISIADGRHPVVEASQNGGQFVPNDTLLNCENDRVAIITGPNMAGKSTYMRQTALIVLMAQIGSFVPAKSATIGIVDRVFTRIGASDDLAAGQSTFMVEMSEMADILKYATGRSLLVLDEIGRGTSTYDGMAIARAVLEYCADKRKLGAKTMFATHYHELSTLEGSLPGVKNYNITAKKQAGKLIFLRKIVPGAADDSYGIEVAKLAGVPDAIIDKAKNYLSELEASGAAYEVSRGEPSAQISLSDVGEREIRNELLRIDPNSLTPMEAINVLYELKKKVDG